MWVLPLLAVGIGESFASCWMKVSRLNLIRSSSESLASDSSDSELSPESESLPELDESLSDSPTGALMKAVDAVATWAGGGDAAARIGDKR